MFRDACLRLCMLIGAAAMCAVGGPRGAVAADYYVDDATGSDSWTGLCQSWDGKSCGPKKTIAAALSAAQNGDTVIILPGEYRGNGNRDLDFGGQAITVRSIDAEDPAVVEQTVIDCEGTVASPHRAFSFVSGEGLGSILAGLTIQNGNSPSYFQSYFGELVSFGGAILCVDSGPMIYRCVIQDCFANAGGAVNAERSTSLTLIGCLLRRNRACFNCMGGSLLFIPNGGAIRAWGGGTVVLQDCSLIDNTADDGIGSGAGMAVWAPTEMPIDLQLMGCTFENNHVLGNSTEYGGGGGAVAIAGFQLLANEYVYISGCRFRENSGPPPEIFWRGGAIRCMGDRLNLVIENSTFELNRAPYAGAVFADCAQYSLRGCLFAVNFAERYPAFALPGPESLSSIVNCTIAGHFDANGPAVSMGGTPSVSDCIFWNDTPTEISPSGTPTIEYSNIKGGFAGPGNIDADPLFVDPANGDYRLSPGSACINAGDPATSGAGQTDLDGNARVWGGRIDMGAYEAGSFAFGDLNCDGSINAFDINPFITALGDPSSYAIHYPDCSRTLADANLNGSVNTFDIEAFIGLLIQ